MRLWYEKPAASWDEGLPLGNGRLGAIAFGKPSDERIALNEDSLWYGGPRNRNNPDAKRHLPLIRKLLREGKPGEAQRLAETALSGVPESQRHYVPLCDLSIRVEHEERAVESYVRELQLTTGISRVRYETGGVRYERELFVSYPDQALVARLTSSSAEGVSMRLRLTRGPGNRYYDELIQAGPDTIVMRGHGGGDGGVAFRVCLKAVADSGKVKAVGEYLTVEGAECVTLLLTAATTYRYDDPEKECLEAAGKAAELSYEALRMRHALDVRAFMSRVSLELGGGEEGTQALGAATAHGEVSRVSAGDDAANAETAYLLPTDCRLERLRDGGEDPSLFALYYQFGRYLLVASSRPGSLPANLQGVWNEHMQPPWDSKYTININTQMNYWPAEAGNLPECHEPLFDHIGRMAENGRVTAREMYGCRGFVAHHNTDLWGDTAPQDVYMPATYWPMGAAWLCLHLWEHYEYGRSRPFLRRVYPIMRETAAFFEDFLTETASGLLVTSPSVSPENTYILPGGERGILCEGPAMDNQILSGLFSACIMAADELGTDSELVRLWKELSGRLPKPGIGRYGQLMEWMEDYEEAEPGHRHISHLFALYPGNGIDPRTTPELAQAARVSLERRLARGGGHTGWSRAWIINLWARLEDGEQAYDNLRALLEHSTLPNLFDNHPPFQIDGNFGGTAGIGEMLLQSHAGCIHLLPALPGAWPSGHARGLRARGGFELSIAWRDGRLSEASIRADRSAPCAIRVTEEVVVEDGSGHAVSVERGGEDTIRWVVRARETYRLIRADAPIS
ncbi:glycoside hydrolase family 95 protein [Paenibacillus soyae]|uniref:Glycoside hydrolase family 95 protein n=1 Tax=Paenibacillus soyae TaxID=2969249 RepID=A0A9X2MVF4_9BACL|nr:glycoside hydrolase family 95 protein [Paenibacillus soyae]MCR2807047.1 glycoside hydrolase family 95 protein [Paenibacillus soyae]